MNHGDCRPTAMPKPAESYGFIFLSEPSGLCILRNRPVRLAMQNYFLVMHPEDRAVTFDGDEPLATVVLMPCLYLHIVEEIAIGFLY